MATKTRPSRRSGAILTSEIVIAADSAVWRWRRMSLISRCTSSLILTMRLDTDVRGYLMYLENVRILSGTERELVIDRLMALEADEIDIEQVKWVVLMVLFSQPGQESAYAQMEDLVFEERTDALH